MKGQPKGNHAKWGRFQFGEPPKTEKDLLGAQLSKAGVLVDGQEGQTVGVDVRDALDSHHAAISWRL